jgi:hypothetical protein
MLPISTNGIFDSLRSPVESIFESASAARPDLASLFEPGAEVSLNPQPLPPGELFATDRFGDEVSLNPQPLPPIGEADEELDFGEKFEDAEMDFGDDGEEVSLNPQPLPPIDDVEPEFRIPEQFVPQSDATLKLGDRDFDFMAQDRAVSLADFDVEPLQLDLTSQTPFDASAFQASMMVQ